MPAVPGFAISIGSQANGFLYPPAFGFMSFSYTPCLNGIKDNNETGTLGGWVGGGVCAKTQGGNTLLLVFYYNLLAFVLL